MDSKTKNMYILLVEEDHFYASMISGFLKKEGFGQIKHIDNSIDCLLQVYDEVTPDLVIMDARLGRVNGVEVIEKLLRHKPGLKVVILTGESNGKRITQSVQNAVIDIIVKDELIFDRLMPHVRIIHSELINSRKNRPVSNLLVSFKRFIFAP